jgi:hypothetical protein
MTQVAGRAGRNESEGYVVLQTYVPKNPVYLTCANYDYLKFYDKEINLRETTKFPPFAKVVRILLTSLETLLLSCNDNFCADSCGTNIPHTKIKIKLFFIGICINVYIIRSS